MPLVTSHSRRSASARSPHTGRPKSTALSSIASVMPSTRIERVLILARVFGVLLDQLRHEGRPAGLMARTEPLAGIAVKILVERNHIAPQRIRLKRRVVAENSTAAVRIACEQADQAVRKFGGDLPERQHLAR